MAWIMKWEAELGAPGQPWHYWLVDLFYIVGDLCDLPHSWVLRSNWINRFGSELKARIYNWTIHACNVARWWHFLPPLLGFRAWGGHCSCVPWIPSLNSGWAQRGKNEIGVDFRLKKDDCYSELCWCVRNTFGWCFMLALFCHNIFGVLFMHNWNT